MAKRILVVHGPNLNLLGERPGDEKGLTLEELNRRIRERAAELGLEVKIFQSNHEGALVELLHAERKWADGILINPAALTHTSYVLREALAAVDLPAIEVHLTDIRRRESWRRKSVIKDVCRAQVMGKGFESYLIALGRFAAGDLAGRKRATRAREGSATPAARKAEAKAKAGAAEKARAASKKGGPAIEFLTRALVRQKIADRLAGTMSPGALASWARAHWLEVRSGGAAETGHRGDLEDSLQALTLSTVGPSKLSDEQLIELMTQLDG